MWKLVIAGVTLIALAGCEDGPGRRTRPAIGRPRRGTVDSLGAVALEPEAELHAHLKMRHLAVGHMAADVGDLEPFDMAQALAGGADRLFSRHRRCSRWTSRRLR